MRDHLVYHNLANGTTITVCLVSGKNAEGYHARCPFHSPEESAVWELNKKLHKIKSAWNTLNKELTDIE